MSGSVDVVVLTWNDGPLLTKCLESVKSSQGVATKLFVFDNGSSPPAEVDDDAVILVRSDLNRGTTAPRNEAASIGRADFVCFLDSDAEVHVETLQTMVDVLEKDPTVGLVAPVFEGQLPTDSAGSYPAVARKLMRVFGLSSTYKPTPQQGTAAENWDIEFAISACIVVRRTAFAAIQGFDERYFSAPEDLDLCVRLGNAGWKLCQVPTASCVHSPRRRTRRVFNKRGLDHAVSYLQFLVRNR